MRSAPQSARTAALLAAAAAFEATEAMVCSLPEIYAPPCS